MDYIETLKNFEAWYAERFGQTEEMAKRTIYDLILSWEEYKADSLDKEFIMQFDVNTKKWRWKEVQNPPKYLIINEKKN